MSVLIRFNKLLKNMAGKEQAHPVHRVAQRFLQIFRDHGVEAAQIPRLIPEVTLDALKSEETLLAVLSPEILDKTAKVFGIRCQWLENVDDNIYEGLWCYKQPSQFFEHLAMLQGRPNYDYSLCPVRVLTTTKNLDCNDPREQSLLLVLVENIVELGDRWIYRYHVFHDGWDWGYSPSRIQLKAMARTVFKTFHTPVPLFVISPDDLERVREGKKVPGGFLHGCLLTEPSLEDFALQRSESVKAREVEEMTAVLRYIDDNNFRSLLSATANPLELVPVALETATAATTSEVPTASPTEPDKGEVATLASSDWKDSARVIADELAGIDAGCGSHDSISGIASRVAVEMRKRKIYGPRGPLAEGTILRNALQGGQWKRKS